MKKFIILLLILASVVILFNIASPVLAADCPANGAPPQGETVCNPAPGLFVDLARITGYDNTFKGLLRFLINIALSIVGLISILFIIYGGFQYITARGDEEMASSGKRTLLNAIIGLIIVILSYIIVAVINNAF